MYSTDLQRPSRALLRHTTSPLPYRLGERESDGVLCAFGCKHCAICRPSLAKRALFSPKLPALGRLPRMGLSAGLMALAGFREASLHERKRCFSPHSHRDPEKNSKIAVFHDPDCAERVFRSSGGSSWSACRVTCDQQAINAVLSPWIVFVTDNLQAHDNSLTTSHSQSP